MSLNIIDMTDRRQFYAYLGLNISKISGAWEENGPNFTPDKHWPTSASIEVKVIPSNK